jgi:hypothetical protein
MKPIPKSILAENQLELDRHAAALLLTALSQSGLDVSEVERRAGMEAGAFKDFISKLTDGEVGILSPASEMAYAMGLKIRLGLESFLPPAESHDKTERHD